MKWIKNLSMAAGAIGVAATAAQAAPTATTGTFTMRSPGGGTVGVFGVTGTYDSTAGTWAVASTSPFFGVNWTAHDGTLLHPGHYTIAAVPPNGTYTGPGYTSFTVPAGMVGGHILFDYGPTLNIDVVIVWDAAGTATDPDGDTIPGTPMLDGAFPGWNAAFDVSPGPVYSGVVIPEPMSMALVGSSLIGLAGLRRRMKK
jgi:hypothetical protein